MRGLREEVRQSLGSREHFWGLGTTSPRGRCSREILAASLEVTENRARRTVWMGGGWPRALDTGTPLLGKTRRPQCPPEPTAPVRGGRCRPPSTLQPGLAVQKQLVVEAIRKAFWERAGYK